MEPIIQEMDINELLPIFNIPEEMKNSRVEVIIRPIIKKPQDTIAERIREFRKKYNRDSFTEHLKKQAADGYVFSFDIQKVINNTETEDEIQARYRFEKQAWSNKVKEQKQQKYE